jgi:hypothetical protein
LAEFEGIESGMTEILAEKLTERKRVVSFYYYVQSTNLRQYQKNQFILLFFSNLYIIIIFVMY